jgi:hypothetical protein
MSIDVLWDLSLIEHEKIMNIIANAPTNEEKSRIWDKRCHILRYILEPYIYNYLLVTYGPALDKFWQTYRPPKKADNAFCIVERRPHPNFWYILRNIAWAAPQMSVYIFCSNENEDFIRTLLGDKAEYYNIIPFFKGNPSREQGVQDYNNFYTNYRSYEMIDAKYIMTVQMDIFIRRKLDMDMFMTDYYGNPWAWNQEDPGGGGATVRRVEKMIEICRRWRPDPTIDCPIPEDGWINEKIKECGTWPNKIIRSTTFMETLLHNNPYVVHQTWSFTDVLLKDGKDVFLGLWRTLLTFTETSVKDHV